MASHRAALAATAFLAAAAVVVPPPAPANASGIPGACPDAGGVTVVVDFQGLGGGTVVRCAPGPQETGLAALKDAGFAVTGTARWGEAFICRIEGRPGPDRESCIDTPPASAYWSYWYAPDGGSWSYSQYGATGRTPPPGSFEGWSFSLDRAGTGAAPPRVAPRRPPAPREPEQPEQPEPPRQPGGSPPAVGEPPGSEAGRPPADRGAGDQPRPPGPAPSASTRATASTPATPSAATTAVPPGSGTAGPLSVPPDLDNAAGRSGPGVPTGAIVGIGLVAALLVATGVTVWRRREPG